MVNKGGGGRSAPAPSSKPVGQRESATESPAQRTARREKAFEGTGRSYSGGGAAAQPTTIPTSEYLYKTGQAPITREAYIARAGKGETAPAWAVKEATRRSQLTIKGRTEAVKRAEQELAKKDSAKFYKITDTKDKKTTVKYLEKDKHKRDVDVDAGTVTYTSTEPSQQADVTTAGQFASRLFGLQKKDVKLTETSKGGLEVEFKKAGRVETAELSTKQVVGDKLVRAGKDYYFDVPSTAKTYPSMLPHYEKQLKIQTTKDLTALGEMPKQRAVVESAKKFYKDEPYQMYGQTFKTIRPKFETASKISAKFKDPKDVKPEEDFAYGRERSAWEVLKARGRLTDDLPGDISLRGQIKQYKKLVTQPGDVLKVGVFGGAAFGLAVAGAAKQTITDPVGTAKGFYEFGKGAVFHPVKTTTDVLTSFSKDPFGTAGEFYFYGKLGSAIAKAQPIRYGKVKVQKVKALGDIGKLKTELAKAATKRGGYIGGRTAVELQLPKKSKIKGTDVDIYFRDIAKIDPFVKEAKTITEKYYDASKIKVEPAKSHIKIKDVVTGKDIVDIGLRLQPGDKVVKIGDIAARDYRQVLGDYKKIAKFEKVDISKVRRAKEKIAEIERAEELGFTTDKTIWRGLYAKFGEGRAEPLVGITEGGKARAGLFRFGEPTAARDFPSLKESALPDWSKKNIASYPQTAIETKILTSPEALTELGFTPVDITKIEITKEVLGRLKKQRSIFKADLPRETKVLGKQELDIFYKKLQKKPKGFVRIYGSAAHIPKLAPEYKRIAGDIELEFKTEAAAKQFGESIIQDWQKIGKKAKLTEVPGLGIEVAGEKAVELKFKGDTSELELSKGARYGYEEYRPSVKMERIPTQTAYEQLIRKAGTSATWWAEKGKEQRIIEPPEHRAKDVVDTYAIGKTLALSRTKTKPIRERIFGTGQQQDFLFEAYKGLEWRHPEVKELFKELEMNRQKYLAGIKFDLTGEVMKKQTKVFKQPKVSAFPSRPSVSARSRASSFSGFPSLSGYPSASASKSMSKSASKSVSRSSSLSRSMSSSLSKSISLSSSPSLKSSLSVSPYRSPYRSTSPYPSSSYYDFFGEGKKKILIPSIFPEERGKRKRKEKFKGDRLFKYQAGLREIMTGITVKKAPKGRFGGLFTGEQLRPVVRGGI